MVARGLEPGCLDGQGAAALFEVVTEGERVCAAMKALLARRVDETKVWREGGHRSAAHWVAEATGETVGAASRTLETARALDALPATADAFRAGRLSETQAAEITSTAAADPGAESELLETASSTSVKGLRDHGRQVRAGAEADDQAWARRLHETRRAHKWSDPDGAYRMEARLAPDAGGTSPVPPMPPTRSSHSPAKALASRSRSASLSTALLWPAGTLNPVSSVRSAGSVPYQ
jgi:hypothetical protein